MAVLAQDLRDAVLQAAISGKLTEQLDTDSSVDELLAKIKAEKEQLIKDKKIKKEKAIAEITEDDIPFAIPSNWRWVRMGNIGETNIGLTYKPTDIVNVGIPVLRSNNIQNNKMDYSDLVCVSCDIPERAQIQKGDILICVRNGSRRLVGKSAIVDKDGMSFGAFMAKFHSDYNDFVNLFLSSQLFRGKLDGVKTETINQITQDMLKNQIMPFPPIEEQFRIVAKVEEIMQKIDEYEKIEKQLESIKKAFPMDMRDALLQAAMQGKLTEQLDTDSSVDDLIEQIKAEREKLVAEGKIKKSKGKKSQQNDYFADLTEDEQPFEIPTNWKFINLSSVSYTNGGYAFKSTDYTSEGIRVIRISDFNNNGILDEEIVRYSYNQALEPFKIKQNDILMCMTGGTVGKCCIVDKIIEDMATNQRVANISSLGINAKFLYLAIKSPFIQKIIQNNKTSTNDNISMDLILSFPIPLPPLEEQERIVKVLNDLLPLCEAL